MHVEQCYMRMHIILVFGYCDDTPLMLYIAGMKVYITVIS